MAVNRIPLYKNNYTTLKQVFPSQITEYDANGTPYFKNTYESKTDLYINKNKITSVSRCWDQLDKNFQSNICQITVDGIVGLVLVEGSYNNIKEIMDGINENDLYDSGCACAT